MDLVASLCTAMNLPSADAVYQALITSTEQELAALSRTYGLSPDLLFAARFAARARSLPAAASQPPAVFQPVRDRHSILAFIDRWRLRPLPHSEHLYTNEFFGSAPRTLPQILRTMRGELLLCRQDILPADHAAILREVVSHTSLREAYDSRVAFLDEPAKQAHTQGTASFAEIASVLLLCLGPRATLPLYADVVTPRRPATQKLRDAYHVWYSNVQAWEALRFPTPATIRFHAFVRLLTTGEFTSFAAQPDVDPYLQPNLDEDHAAVEARFSRLMTALAKFCQSAHGDNPPAPFAGLSSPFQAEIGRAHV